MKHYSESFRQEIVRQFIDSPWMSLRAFSKEIRIGRTTLTRWIRRYHNSPLSNLSQRSHGWSDAQKSTILSDCADLNDIEVGAYCRQHGLYRCALNNWRNDMKSNKPKTMSEKQLAELTTLRKDNKALERKLKKKEKALQEAQALLELKKKVDTLFKVNKVS